MNVCVVTTVTMVTGFWTLWDNIYEYVCLLIQIFPSFIIPFVYKTMF
jgi:hypothetical protein